MLAQLLSGECYRTEAGSADQHSPLGARTETGPGEDSADPGCATHTSAPAGLHGTVAGVSSVHHAPTYSISKDAPWCSVQAPAAVPVGTCVVTVSRRTCAQVLQTCSRVAGFGATQWQVLGALCTELGVRLHDLLSALQPMRQLRLIETSADGNAHAASISLHGSAVLSNRPSRVRNVGSAIACCRQDAHDGPQIRCRSSCALARVDMQRAVEQSREGPSWPQNPSEPVSMPRTTLQLAQSK
jgi:hypothetical protein